jgi:hypothetical protein
MRGSWSKVGRFTTVLMLAGAIVAGTYAFTAANTVPTSHAGDGTGTVSGYTISGIHYNLAAAGPTINSVDLTLDVAAPATSTGRIQMGATWYSCTVLGTAVNCVTTGQAITPVVSLEVVVAD